MTANTAHSPLLCLRALSKDYGQGEVLHQIDLEIDAGEFLTLLGPSGCGKTTTLRIIAGLEKPSFGSVFLEGQDVTWLPPEQRGVNTVFQNYALFPHMNVFQNIAYGLKVQRSSKDEQEVRVREMLELVQLSGYERRMPQQLSGGQRQRVAIARALVLKPKVLLLDEPLGALDLKLRQQMQTELKKLQQGLGITFIYITHDQEEALNMSSRVVVMREGRIEQIGTPEDVYERPQTLFCAGFIGQSNLLSGTVSDMQEDGSFLLDVGGVRLPALLGEGQSLQTGDKASLCLRPQRLRYSSDEQKGLAIPGVIAAKEYTGGMQHTHIALEGGISLAAVSQTAELDRYALGETVYVDWDIRHAPVIAEVPADEPKAGEQ